MFKIRIQEKNTEFPPALRTYWGGATNRVGPFLSSWDLAASKEAARKLGVFTNFGSWFFEALRNPDPSKVANWSIPGTPLAIQVGPYRLQLEGPWGVLGGCFFCSTHGGYWWLGLMKFGIRIVGYPKESQSHYGSMGLVYSPTWMVDVYGKCR